VIHWDSFRFPAVLILQFAGLEEAKNLAGRGLRLIQDRLGDAEFEKTSLAGQDNSPQARILASVPETLSIFHPRAQ